MMQNGSLLDHSHPKRTLDHGIDDQEYQQQANQARLVPTLHQHSPHAVLAPITPQQLLLCQQHAQQQQDHQQHLWVSAPGIETMLIMQTT
jgi:phosphoglycerol transferase MdoB-like AlkP superfamily enzyme